MTVGELKERIARIPETLNDKKVYIVDIVHDDIRVDVFVHSTPARLGGEIISPSWVDILGAHSGEDVPGRKIAS